MKEHKGAAVADALPGGAWNSGGWIMRVARSAGAHVTLSDDPLCEHEGEEALETLDARLSIRLT